MAAMLYVRLSQVANTEISFVAGNVVSMWKIFLLCPLACFPNTIKWKSIFYYVYAIFLIEFPIPTIKNAIFKGKIIAFCHAQQLNKPTYSVQSRINNNIKCYISVRVGNKLFTHAYALWSRKKSIFLLFIQPNCDNDDCLHRQLLFPRISNKKKPYRNLMCAEFTIKPKKCQIKYIHFNLLSKNISNFKHD